MQELLVALAAAATVQSAHDISDGGIATALAESCFAATSETGAPASFGAKVKLEGDAPPEHALYSERGGRAFVSVNPASLARVLETARQYNVAAEQVGQVTRDNALRIEYNGHAAIDSPVAALRDVWDTSLERAVKA